METIRRGKILTCVYCGLIVQDREINWGLSCLEGSLGHDFIETGKYLERSEYEVITINRRKEL